MHLLWIWTQGIVNILLIDIDSCDVGIGSVLMQPDESDQLHQISYFSKKLNKFQKSYSTIEKEAFALFLSIQHFEVYITSS